jgi:hypothetical protein
MQEKSYEGETGKENLPLSLMNGSIDLFDIFSEA